MKNISSKNKESYIPFLPVTSVLSKNLLSSTSPYVICILCKGLICKPLQCLQCSKCYCKSCLTIYKKYNNYNSPCGCNSSMIPPSKFIKEMLSKFSFSCPYNCNDDQYDYYGIVNHIIICKKVKIPCPSCGVKVSSEKIQNIKELNEIKIDISILSDQLDITKNEIRILKKELEELTNKKTKKNYYSTKNKKSTYNIVDLSNESNPVLIDKCEHFMGNYKPIFACCGKAYPCYLCHNEKQKHKYEFSNKVICLICNIEYTGMVCPKCGAAQIYKKKKFI